MSFQIAIARFNSLPTIFDHAYATPDAAPAVADEWARRDETLGGGKTGDYYVIPAVEPRTHVSSATVREIAVATPHEFAGS